MTGKSPDEEKDTLALFAVSRETKKVRKSYIIISILKKLQHNRKFSFHTSRHINYKKKSLHNEI